MLFLVKFVGYKPHYSQKILFLIKDMWYDWYRFETMYDLAYVDEYGECKQIGKIKIAEVEMKSNQRRPNIPDEFESLDKNFYSLGQLDYYYENLNRLGEKIRKEVLQSLNDIALNIDLFQELHGLPVAKYSLMTNISIAIVSRQFRIANGGVRLTEYDFSFISSRDEKALSGP